MRSLFTIYTDFSFDNVEKCGFIKTKNNKFLTKSDIDQQIHDGNYVNLYWVDYETNKEDRIMHVTVKMMIMDSHTIIINMPETSEEEQEEHDACSTMSELKPIPKDVKSPRDVRGRRVKMGDTIRCQGEKYIVEKFTYMGIPDREKAKKFDDDGWYINHNIPLYLCEIFTGKLDQTIGTLAWYKHKIPKKLFSDLYSQTSFEEFQDILFDEKETIPEGVYIDLQNSLKRDFSGLS